MAAEADTGAPTMTTLVKGIVTDIGDLVRQEMRFARKEVGSDLRKTRTAVTYLSVGAALGLVGVIVMSLALGLLLNWLTWPRGTETAGLPLWAALGIISLLLLGVGGATAWAGAKKFESFNPLPDKTIQTIQENVSWTTNSTGATTASST